MITIYLKQYNKVVKNADVKLLEELGYEDILWIDLLEPTVKERRVIESYLGIDLQTEQQVEEIETTSKYSETENAVICNSSYLTLIGDTFEPIPVSLIVTKEILISLRQVELRSLTEAAKRLQMNFRNYTSGFHILISILEVRIDYDADLIEALVRQITILSKELLESSRVSTETIKRINILQENTMMIRESIFDRQRVLSGIQRSVRFPKETMPKLTLMIKDVLSLISHTDFNSERLDYLQETAMGLMNIEQNNVTKIFTIAAVFFMPPTMIASIYGMNFKIIPELQWEYGYFIALGLMAFSIIGTYLFFKWKKWL